ncbi:MAG: hypothetical protein ACJ76K_15755, partial [Solirubrobacteraceae bacterium]
MARPNCDQVAQLSTSGRMGAVRTATAVWATFPPRSQVGSGVSAVVGEPGFGGFKIADVKRLGASGEH